MFDLFPVHVILRIQVSACDQRAFGAGDAACVRRILLFSSLDASQSMGETRSIIADLDERPNAIRRQHPLQRFAHLQVTVGTANSGQQQNFTANGRDNLLRCQQNATAFAAFRQSSVLSVGGFISSPSNTARGPSLHSPLQAALGTYGSLCTTARRFCGPLTGAGTRHFGGSAGSGNAGLG